MDQGFIAAQAAQAHDQKGCAKGQQAAEIHQLTQAGVGPGGRFGGGGFSHASILQPHQRS